MTTRPPTKLVKEYTFTEREVREWCERSDNSNSLYLDGSDRIVPLPMIIDVASGRAETLVDVREPELGVFASSIKTFPRGEALRLEEAVEITAEFDFDDERYSYVYFEARATERDTVCAEGYVSVLVE